MMTKVGTLEQPLRVAIVGAGPAGFYTAEHLFEEPNLVVEVDMFDKLPTPYGLVRTGVAPDHQKIKRVTKLFDKTAVHPRFRFFGNVELGRDLHVQDLEQHYHQIVYATGAQTDRRLEIPGIELINSHAATDFVAWYNGHPDYRHLQFDLSQERVAIIGAGNVALDVARILCRTPEELATTDIADYAFEALCRSRVKEVTILARRGPAQVAFTPPEVREIGELADADVSVLPHEVALDPLSEMSLKEKGSSSARKMVDYFQQYATQKRRGKARQLAIRFLVSPLELCGLGTGRVERLRVVKNELRQNAAGALRPCATQTIEEWPAGLVFYAIGYRGVALPGVSFDDERGVIPTERGRVVDSQTGKPVLGAYAAGWIKRGPTGVIGTNKADAAETVEAMVEDVANDRMLKPPSSDKETIEGMIRRRQPCYFSYADWLQLDLVERVRGEAQGRPRVKFTSVADMGRHFPSKTAVFPP